MTRTSVAGSHSIEVNSGALRSRIARAFFGFRHKAHGLVLSCPSQSTGAYRCVQFWPAMLDCCHWRVCLSAGPVFAQRQEHVKKLWRGGQGEDAGRKKKACEGRGRCLSALAGRHSRQGPERPLGRRAQTSDSAEGERPAKISQSRRRRAERAEVFRSPVDNGACRPHLEDAIWRPKSYGSRMTPVSPRDDRPDPLMQVIPGDLGDDLHSSDRACNRHSAGHEPTDRKRVQGPQRPPAYGLEHRSRMSLRPGYGNKRHRNASLLDE